MSVCVWAWVHVSRCHRGQKKAADHLEVEIKAIISYLKWVLGIKFRSSPKAVSDLN